MSILRYTLSSNISRSTYKLNNAISSLVYMQAHPDVQAYRTKVVPFYEELCIICGHTVADGRYSLSCFDVGFECEGRNKCSNG